MRKFFQRTALGPLALLKRRWRLSLGLLGAILLLTVLTQIGGILLWVSLPWLAKVPSASPAKRRLQQLLAFGAVYVVVIALVLPLLAPLNGRVPLPCFATSETPLKPANLGYCLLARNYVRPSLRQLLENTAQSLAQQYPEARLQYLDANFPFLNGIPLLPHLSHSDGKKVDLAFFYRDSETKKPVAATPSPLGYWAYEQPLAGESQPCRDVRSRLRWDFDWLQPLFASSEIDPERTRRMVQVLVANGQVQKVFMEPHLKGRLGLTSSKVRFQGCHAARHDDHVHVQVGG